MTYREDFTLPAELSYLPNSHNGGNHLLVISSAFGLLSARAGIWSGRSFAP
jgi:hypothetical protein